jgi:hypothetical protein
MSLTYLLGRATGSREEVNIEEEERMMRSRYPKGDLLGSPYRGAVRPPLRRTGDNSDYLPAVDQLTEGGRR